MTALVYVDFPSLLHACLSCSYLGTLYSHTIFWSPPLSLKASTFLFSSFGLSTHTISLSESSYVCSFLNPLIEKFKIPSSKKLLLSPQVSNQTKQTRVGASSLGTSWLNHTQYHSIGFFIFFGTILSISFKWTGAYLNCSSNHSTWTETVLDTIANS